MPDETSVVNAVRFGHVLRWLAGAMSLVGGLAWLLITQLDGVRGTDLVTSVILTASGLVLLMPHRVALPVRITAPVMITTGLVGAIAGLAAGTSRLCCMYAYVTDRGWPYAWAQRGAVADDADTAVRLARSAGWTVDLAALAWDLVLWAYAGMLVLVLVRAIRRDRRGLG